MPRYAAALDAYAATPCFALMPAAMLMLCRRQMLFSCFVSLPMPCQRAIRFYDAAAAAAAAAATF